MFDKNIGRRQFLRLSAMGTAGAFLTACAPSATSTSEPAPGDTAMPAATQPAAQKYSELRTHAQMVKDGNSLQSIIACRWNLGS